jgi:HEAT repeat protein
VEVLIGLLGEEGPEQFWGQRASVAYALGRVGDERAASALIRATYSESDRIKVEAVASLGLLHVTGAFDRLRHLLEDEKEDTNVRANAAQAIGLLAHPGSVEVLKKAQHDRQEFVAHCAAEALRELTQGPKR